MSKVHVIKRNFLIFHNILSPVPTSDTRSRAKEIAQRAISLINPKIKALKLLLSEKPQIPGDQPPAPEQPDDRTCRQKWAKGNRQLTIGPLNQHHRHTNQGTQK